jgi:hypothetical protein
MYWQILPVFRKSWSITLREERRLKVCENRVLRGVLGAKRDEEQVGWRKLRIEKLCNI